MSNNNIRDNWRRFWNWRPFMPPDQQRRLDVYDVMPHEGLMLDLGCGDGWISSRFTGKTVGLEYDWANAVKSQANAVNVVQADALHLPFKDNAFKAVISLHVLDHTPDNRVVCQEVGRVLNSGGVFYALLPGLIDCPLFNQTMAKQYATVHRHYPEPEMRQWLDGTSLELLNLTRTPGFVANLAIAINMMWVEYSWIFAKWLLGSHSRSVEWLWHALTRLMQLVTGPIYFFSQVRSLWGKSNHARYGIDWMLIARRSEK